MSHTEKERMDIVDVMIFPRMLWCSSDEACCM